MIDSRYPVNHQGLSRRRLVQVEEALGRRNPGLSSILGPISSIPGQLIPTTFAGVPWPTTTGSSSSGGDSSRGNSANGSGHTSGGTSGSEGSDNTQAGSSGSSPGNASPSSSAETAGPSSSGSSVSSSDTSGSAIPASASTGSPAAGSHTESTSASSSVGQSDKTASSEPGAAHGSVPTTVSGHGTSTSGGGSSGGSIDGTTSGRSSHGPSAIGTIAGVVVTAIVLFAILILLLLRRRNTSRRAQRRAQWSQVVSSSWNQPSGNGSVAARDNFIRRNPITRKASPAIPPMAEIRDTRSHGFITHTQQVDYRDFTAIALNYSPGEERQRRNSAGSKRSSTGSRYPQTSVIRELPVAVAGGNDDSKLSNSPISVRPFSASETFSFPKPPTPSGYVRDRNGCSPATYMSVRTSLSSSEFSFGFPQSPTQESIYSDDLSTSVPSSTAAYPFVDFDPFMDPFQIIRRSFVPVLDGEMHVYSGDRVNVIQVYSDGWTLVEKYAGDDRKRKGTSLEGPSQGLVPLDCLREAGEELPASFAEKIVWVHQDAAVSHA